MKIKKQLGYRTGGTRFGGKKGKPQQAIWKILRSANLPAGR
jgi:hypothetical protein